MINLKRLEVELKKRLNYPYQWGKKQNDDWDRKTNFIYSSRSFAQLQHHTHHLDSSLQNYAFNRWLNFWSAQAVEQLFGQHHRVLRHANAYDKYTDFYIEHIPFDHKTSVYPKGFRHSLAYAIEHKRQLIEWFYQSQSTQGRHHDKNRLFLVLYDTMQGEHWRLKAEIKLMQTQITQYLNTFDPSKLERIERHQRSVLSDIIWIIR